MKNTFIDLNKNDTFSNLRGLDLQDLLLQIQGYLLEYRDKLYLSDNLTFGAEIEYEGLSKLIADKFVNKNLKEWGSDIDGSLKSGGEIISPVMTDNIKCWQELKTICDYLAKKKVNTLDRAGGHIHIGTCILGDDIDAWCLFLKLYAVYESVIFRFIYGDKINARYGMQKYAPPLADLIHEIIFIIDRQSDLVKISHYLPRFDRYHAINFSNVLFYSPNDNSVKNTIEFRSPNATTNAIIWQNNINMFAKILMSSKRKKIDVDYLNYELKYDFISYKGNEYMYNTINLKKALEFVDLVFDNNLDKVYFLRQYIKNYQDGYGLQNTVKAKKFTR